MGLLYMMRSITMYATVLPVASKTYYCSPKANNTSPLLVTKRVLQLISGFGLSINGKHTYCGDYIYSGHTVVLLLSYLIIKECKYTLFIRLFFPLLLWFLHRKKFGTDAAPSGEAVAFTGGELCGYTFRYAAFSLWVRNLSFFGEQLTYVEGTQRSFQ